MRFAVLFILAVSFSCLLFSRGVHVQIADSSSYPVHNLNTGLNYAKIQDAIDASQTVNGQTIKVDAGTYYEHLLLDKSITLVGEGGNTTIVDGNGTGTIIEIMTDHVSIVDLTARNAGPNADPLVYGACVDAQNVHDIDVENNVFLNAGRGIVVGRSFSVNVNNNIILNMVSYGIDVGDWQIPGVTRNVTISNNSIRFSAGPPGSGINLDGDSENCTIANNTVQDCHLGIDLLPNIDTHIVPTNNLVDGNALTNNTINLIIMGELGQSQESYTNTFRRNNLTNKQGSNLIVWGYELAVFMQDIDSSNSANGKEIDYLTNRSDFEIDPSNRPDAGYLALVNCTNATVRDFDFVGNRDGLLLAGTTNCTLTNMTLGNDQPYVYAANASQPTYGLTFFESSNNTVENCKFCNDTCGIVLYHSDRNLFRHNSFLNNYESVFSEFSTDAWDDGIEGNYWSDFNGTDSNHDGIGDTPYIIDANNTDDYPLMGTFHEFNVPLPYGQTGTVEVVTNSTVSNFTLAIWLSSPHDGLQPGQPLIHFFVDGVNGTVGFCRLIIPRAVLNGSSYQVYVDSNPVNATSQPIPNSTDAYLYFTYTHSTHEVMVTIPEYSPLALFLVMMSILVAATGHRHKKRC